MLILTHQNLTLGMCWKLFLGTLILTNFISTVTGPKRDKLSLVKVTLVTPRLFTEKFSRTTTIHHSMRHFNKYVAVALNNRKLQKQSTVTFTIPLICI